MDITETIYKADSFLLFISLCDSPRASWNVSCYGPWSESAALKFLFQNTFPPFFVSIKSLLKEFKLVMVAFGLLAMRQLCPY